MGFITRTFSVGAALAALLFVATSSAHAQLALSYKLDVRAERGQQAEVSVNRCAGFNWVTSIGACGREVLTRITQNARSEGPATFEPATTPAGGELPDLGTPERAPRLLRSGGGKEALLASSKTADLLLRFGSKYRLRSNEEGGWDYYRFTDTTYENHIKTRGHKAVGVELLVPFQ
jgi:hypothetical protein